jgi:polysaccharide biosynthesis protein PelC
MSTLQNIALSLVFLFLVGCSSASLVKTEQTLVKSGTVSLFRLHNYTDTPRAGMRSANITEGILLSKGFSVTSHILEDTYTFAKAQNAAKKDKSDYFIVGGVSEWRYKTGIDGEPAVSLQLSMYNTQSGELEWSATGADSDWGTGSIGTTAQKLIQNMME